MNGTLRVFRVEWYRLVHGRAALVAGGVLAAVSALRVVAAWVSQQSMHALAVREAVSAGRALPSAPEAANAYAPFVDGWSAGLVVATLLMLITASRAIAADLDAGLLRLAVTRSCTRTAVVLGRALMGLPIALAAMLVTGAAAMLTAALLFDFGSIVEDGYEIWAAEELNSELLRAAGTTLLPLLATWAFGLAVSSTARSGAGAVAGSLGLYLGFDLFKEVLGRDQYWVFAAFNPSFVDQSYLHEIAAMARGLSDYGFDARTLGLNWWLPAPEAVLCLALACVVLRRRGL